MHPILDIAPIDSIDPYPFRAANIPDNSNMTHAEVGVARLVGGYIPASNATASYST